MIAELLCELSLSAGIGNVCETGEIIKKHLSPLMEINTLYGNCLVGIIKGKTDKTLLLDAHYDEVGFIVTGVYDGGFLRVKPVGAVDARLLPSVPVTVHGKEKLCGVFASVPPHLKGKEESPADFNSLFIDIGCGGNIDEMVALGDYVTFATKPEKLANGIICGKSLDNRAGVAALIKTAYLLKDKPLPCNVAFLFTSGEELGLRGAKTAAFSLMPHTAVAVDVSFGNTPGMNEEDCRNLGSGPMIGTAPVLSRDIFNKLRDVAAEKNIDSTVEVMNRLTGTNADVITVTGGGVPCGLVSVPLRNMHCPAETVDTKDVCATAELLAAYILSGGGIND